MSAVEYTVQMITASQVAAAYDHTAQKDTAQKDMVQGDVCEVGCVHPEAVALARAALPSGEDVETASAFLKLVGDPTRLKVLSALKTCELCVCDLAAVVGISESAVSHQLRLLRAGRVVAFRKVGRAAYYRLLDHHVTMLIDGALEHARE